MSSRRPTNAYNAIYKALSAYPSERVAAVIARRRQHGLFVCASVVREILDAERLVAAVKAATPTEASVASLERIRKQCEPRKDTLDEKIARCMTRIGIETTEPCRPVAGWDYHPDHDDR